MSDKKFTPDENLKKLGKQVRQLRNGHKWSQQKLSDVSGLAVRTVSRIERGLMNPSFEVLSTLASALGTTVKGLLTYPDDESDTDVQELVDLYRTCPKQEQHLILAVTRTMTQKLLEAERK